MQARKFPSDRKNKKLGYLFINQKPHPIWVWLVIKMASAAIHAATTGRSGRKRKAAKHWVLDYPDDLQTLLKMPKGQGAEESSTSHVLVCHFCSIELPTDPKKKPWDRINEYLSSMRHKKLKKSYKERSDKKKQVSLYESVVRQKEKEKEAEGAIHDFENSLLFCYQSQPS